MNIQVYRFLGYRYPD